MTTRTTSPLAGYRWLLDGIKLLDRKPGTLFGALAIFIGISLLPSAVTFWVQYKMPDSTPAMIGVVAFSLIAGLALAPLQGGMFHVVDAIATDRPVRAPDVFAPYRRADQAWPLVGFAFAMMVVVLAIVAVVVLVMGAGMFNGMWASMAAREAQQAGAHMPLPPHFGAIMSLFILFMPLYMALFSIGYCQVALAGRGVIGAVADGFTGGLKNLHVLWILTLGLIVIGFVLGLVFVLVIGLVGLALHALGTVPMMVVLGLVYIVAILAMYAVMFGFSYYLWRDVCGVAGTDAAPMPLAA